MNHAYLLTGGNIGNRQEHLAIAARLLTERCGRIIDSSSLYETEPWGKTDQEKFLNQVLLVETRLPAVELLHCILAIETQMGRNRTEKNGPRLIDIDILFFNHQIVNQPGLTIPHPQMSSRRFVLEPLNEIAPAYIHPIYYKTVSQLLTDCVDPLGAKKL